MWVGEERTSNVQICGRAPVRQMEILGVEFSAVHDCGDINMQGITNKIQNTLNRWSQRDLTLKGRITIAKSLVVSQLIYMMAAIGVAKKHLEAIQSKILKFLWRGRPPKVARKTLYQKIEDGGLNAPNILAMYKAMRVAWLGKIVANQEMAFAKVFIEKIKIKACDLTLVNYQRGWINSRPITQYYKEMLIWFMEAVPMKNPQNGIAVRKQIVWHNKEIRIDKEVILNRVLYNKDIKYIDDFTDSRGRLLGYNAFKERHSIFIGPLRYMSLICAIPADWKRKLMDSESLSTEEKRAFPHIEIQGKNIPIQSVKSSFYRSAWNESRAPRGQLKWETEGIGLDVDWKAIFSLPFKVTASTKLQSLQYRILHRYLPTRRFLCIRGVVDDPFCNECGEIETIQHYVVDCHEVKLFWNEVAEKVNQKLKLSHRFNPRPAGPLDFPPPAGGGGAFERPPPHDLGSWSP